MIESGRVVALQAPFVWVETQQKSACGQCAAKAGCGQSLLSGLYPERRNQLKVLVPANQLGAPSLGDWVEFTVPDNALVHGALRVYLLPLGGLLAATMAATLAGLAEWQCILSGIVGLGAGVALSRYLETHRSQQAAMPQLYSIASQ